MNGMLCNADGEIRCLHDPRCKVVDPAPFLGILDRHVMNLLENADQMIMHANWRKLLL